MLGTAPPSTLLWLLLWLLCPLLTASTHLPAAKPFPPQPRTTDTPLSSPPDLQSSPEGSDREDTSLDHHQHGSSNGDDTYKAKGVGGDARHGFVTDERSGQVTSSSFTAVPSSTSSVSSSSSDSDHPHRHHHAAAPLWLKDHLDSLPRRRSTSRLFEENIAAVFRGVSSGGWSSYRGTALRRQGTREVQAPGPPRVERTTVLSDQPRNDSSGDHHNDLLPSSSDDLPLTRSNDLLPSSEPSILPSSSSSSSSSSSLPSSPFPSSTGGNVGEMDGQENGTVSSSWTEATPTTAVTEQHDYISPDSPDSPLTKVTEKEDATTGTSHLQESVEETTTHTILTTHATLTATITTHATHSTHSRPRLSWLELLRCTQHGLPWVLANFLLGLLLLVLSLLGPYRLLTLRCCTPLLPRTHYVAVHLLVFVAASLKAVYLFHLAFGSRGRLPLVLLLLLTNTGFPCLCSAFLVLLVMMFLAAEVQVYRPKAVTPHSVFFFLVAMLSLAFIADVIVGSAHSRAVLLLSRVMVIGVAISGVVLLLRKHQAVMASAHMMRRELQGELKLLVLPAKDDSLQRRAGVKHILRSRLELWCQAVRVSAAALALLSVVHLLHTVFLVSVHVPAWAWWLFHVSGCLLEALLVLTTCVTAALTQRYDDSVNFAFSFLLPPMLFRRKTISRQPSPAAAAASVDAETLYQRVSFSSGTESTQYTACCPDGGPAFAGTPQASKRRGNPVKRSATFSHTPHAPHPSAPVYGQGLARGGVFRPLHGSLYCPSGDASMLVHEDGFVRVRTPMDLREAPPPRPHGSMILLQQAHFQGSSPHLQYTHLRGSNPQLREAPRHDNAYQSLSRRRRGSRCPEVAHNNLEASESEYQSSPSSRVSYGWNSNLPSPHSPQRDEPDYYSLSRHTARGSQHDNLTHDSWRRRSHREAHEAFLNNLDRPEADPRILARRQVSREDNNDPVHLPYHDHHDPYDYHNSRRRSRDARSPSLNLYEDQAAPPRPNTLSSSPAMTHKVSNRSFSPGTTPTPPGGYASCTAESPRVRRQAKFPRPFVRVGSNRSLQGEELYGGEYIPRAVPLRRNHSSAGYFPSRYMAPSTPSLVEAQRYASLRMPRNRRRHPPHALPPDSGIAMRSPHEWPREGRIRTPDTPNTPASGPEGEEGRAAPGRDCPSRQSTTSKRSEGGDQDWATELIKSSSMLTDFYSLAAEKKAKKKEREREREKEILEEQEE